MTKAHFLASSTSVMPFIIQLTAPPSVHMCDKINNTLVFITMYDTKKQSHLLQKKKCKNDCMSFVVPSTVPSYFNRFFKPTCGSLVAPQSMASWHGHSYHPPKREDPTYIVCNKDTFFSFVLIGIK